MPDATARPLRCSRCGAPAARVESLRRRRWRTWLLECLACASEPGRLAPARQVRGAAVAALLCVAVALLAPPTPRGLLARRIAFVWLNFFVLFPIASALVTLGHELAHACVARAVGLEVIRLQVGSGDPVARRRWFAFDVRLHRIPFGGLTFLAWDAPSALRVRLWLTYAAGPLSHVVSLALLAAALPDVRWTSAPSRGGLALVPILAMMHLLSLLSSAVPYRQGNGLASDGWNLLALPFASRARRAQLRVAGIASRAVVALQDGRLDDASTALEAGLAIRPDDATLGLARATLSLARGDAAAALDDCSALRARADLPAALRPLVANALAWAIHVVGDASRLEEAEALAREAAAALPHEPAIASTLGALLIDRGRAADGLRELERALGRPVSPGLRASMLGDAARALWALGDALQARAVLVRARAIAPASRALERALDAAEQIVATAPPEVAERERTARPTRPRVALGRRWRLRTAAPITICIVIGFALPYLLEPGRLGRGSVERLEERTRRAFEAPDGSVCAQEERNLERWRLLHEALVWPEPALRARLEGVRADLAFCQRRNAEASARLAAAIAATAGERAPAARLALANLHRAAAEVLADSGDDAAAERAYRNAIAVGREVARRDPDGAWLGNCFCAERTLAGFLEERGRVDEARALIDEAQETARRARAPEWILERLEARRAELDLGAADTADTRLRLR